MASGFPEHFHHREFTKALEVVDGLLKKHPNDPLLLRYKGLTLDKLSRHKEAVVVYRQILAQNPQQVPTHLFLGLAYARAGLYADAEHELLWVMEQSQTEEYRHWAQAQRAHLQELEKKTGHEIKKKPYLEGKVGVSYDSNPLFLPKDKSLSSRSRKEGIDYSADLTVGYPLVLQHDARLDVLYLGETVQHDRGARQVDFTSQGVAVDAKQRHFFGPRPWLFGERYDFRTEFLRSDLFAVIHRILLSLDTSFWHRTRTQFYTRASYSNYGPDGSNPPRTSRDGFREGLSVVQYFYTHNFRRYFFVKEEVSFAQARGKNFDRSGSLTYFGIHTPVDFLRRTDLDLATGLDYGTYPQFSSLSTLDTNERRDLRVDVYAALTHHWKPNLATRVFYRFIDSFDGNDLFSYKRHLAGAEVIFSL